ncbi:hypothetical protein [Curtobacterium sp. Leaf261]|uniref:hypothetical protein n=1 Tax=Curtobacterium sp. Leaf261 TaxID=1736311 RepID=UPI0012E0CDAD|nr:hypothetical protein [Curtobacterium sp. Leaf261]
MITDSNIDRAADHQRTNRDGSPRARRRTRIAILRVSFGIVVLGAAFLVVSLLIGATIAPPLVVMVAGVLGALFSGVLRRASAADRPSGHTTE